MRKQYRIWLYYFYFCMCSIILAQGNGIMGINPDARSVSLGGTSPAFSVGAADLYSNPALLALHESNSISFTNYWPWEDYNYGNFYSSFTVENVGVFGLGINGIFIDDIMGYDSNGNFTGKLKNYQFAIQAGYAKSFEPLTIGLSVRYLNLALNDVSTKYSGYGLGFNFGMTYTFHPTLLIGVNYQTNYSVNWNNAYSDKIPGTLNIGLAYSPDWVNEDFSALAISLNQTEYMPMMVNLGTEIKAIQNIGPVEFLALRMGVGRSALEIRDLEVQSSVYWSANTIFSVGSGMRINLSSAFQAEINYSYSIHKFLNNKHVISSQFLF